MLVNSLYFLAKSGPAHCCACCIRIWTPFLNLSWCGITKKKLYCFAENGPAHCSACCIRILSPPLKLILLWNYFLFHAQSGPAASESELPYTLPCLVRRLPKALQSRHAQKMHPASNNSHQCFHRKSGAPAACFVSAPAAVPTGVPGSSRGCPALPLGEKGCRRGELEHFLTFNLMRLRCAAAWRQRLLQR